MSTGGEDDSKQLLISRLAVARRSKAMSQYSTHSNTAVAAPPTARTHDQGRSNIPSAYHTSVYGIGNADGDDERMEELDGNKGQEVPEPARAASPMGMVMPAPGSECSCALP